MLLAPCGRTQSRLPNSVFGISTGTYYILELTINHAMPSNCVRLELTRYITRVAVSSVKARLELPYQNLHIPNHPT